MKAFVRLI